MSTQLQSGCMAEALQAACETVLPGAVFPMVYTGPLMKYVVWNYEIIGQVWAEGQPHAARYLVQVHLYLPSKEEPRGAILALSQALDAAGFTWPDLVNASDNEGQHWTLECEYTDPGGVYGFL